MNHFLFRKNVHFLEERGANKPEIDRSFMELITMSEQEESVSCDPAFLVHPPAVCNFNVTAQLQAKHRCGEKIGTASYSE